MKTPVSLHRRPHFPGHRRLAALMLPLVLVLAAPLTALHAQTPTKIFVASYGSDANDGSRGSPKRNFQHAHDAVAAGGQIVVLDTAGYGALNIAKSLAVTVPPGVNGFVTVTGNSSGITINAGASGSVSLRGLIIEGGSGDGIAVSSAAQVAIEDCTVRNFADGIYVTSSGKLYLRRCTIRACFSNSLIIDRVDPGNNSVIANDCQFVQEQPGATALVLRDFSMGGANIDLTLRKCVISGNSSATSLFGPGALARVDNCRITGNGSGVFDNQVLSRGNNTLENNTNFNTFSGTYSAK